MTDNDLIVEAPPRREAARWVVCFLAVALIHSGAAFALLAQQDEGDQAASSAVMIDFVSIPVPDAPARDLVPGLIEQTQSDAAMEVKSERPDQTPEDDPVSEAKPVRMAETKPTETMPSEIKEAQPVEPRDTRPPTEEPQPVPQLAPVPDAEAVLETTASAPPPPKPVEKVEEKEDKPPKKTPSPVAPSAAVGVTTAPTSAAARNAALVSWKTRLATHLQRYKRYPPGARARGQQGTATARFTVDRNGRVVTATLVRGTGSPALDEEALAMLARSQPMPRPPSSVGGSEFSFSVPIQFSIR